MLINVFFANITTPHIKSDLFIIESIYDGVLIMGELGLPCMDWVVYTINNCTGNDLKEILKFGNVMRTNM